LKNIATNRITQNLDYNGVKSKSFLMQSYLLNVVETTTLLGLVAGSLTTISFIPQVMKTWKYKETKDISLLMYIIFFTGVLLWFLYGFIIKNTPIIVANGLSLILVFIVLILKIRYG